MKEALCQKETFLRDQGGVESLDEKVLTLTGTVPGEDAIF